MSLLGRGQEERLNFGRFPDSRNLINDWGTFPRVVRKEEVIESLRLDGQVRDSFEEIQDAMNTHRSRVSARTLKANSRPYFLYFIIKPCSVLLSFLKYYLILAFLSLLSFEHVLSSPLSFSRSIPLKSLQTSTLYFFYFRSSILSFISSRLIYFRFLIPFQN